MKLLLLNTACFLIAWIIPRAFCDNYLIRKGAKINHPINALLTICVVLWYAWLDKTLLIAPYLLSLYWFVFDPLLNKLRDKDLLYVGTTAWLDRIFRKGLYIKMKYNIRFPVNQPIYYREKVLSPEHLQLTVKLICLGISIGVYVWFKKHSI